MDLLLFFDKCIILGNATKSELVHQVDFVGVIHVLIGEILNGDREGCRKEHDLAILGVELEELFNNGRKFGGEQFISFIHDELRAFAEVGNILSCQVEDSPRCADNNVYRILETKDVIS